MNPLTARSKTPPKARGGFATPYARRMREKRRSAAKRVELRLRGLTSRGTPRKLQIWPKHLFIGCKNVPARKLVRQRIVRQRNLDAGLRSDGKPRVNRRWPQFTALPERKRNIKRTVINQRRRRAEARLTPLDRAWHQFRDTIVLPVGRDSVEP